MEESKENDYMSLEEAEKLVIKSKNEMLTEEEASNLPLAYIIVLRESNKQEE